MSTDNLLRVPEPEKSSESEKVQRDEGGGPLIIDGISYIPSSVLLTGIPKLSFKDDRAFGVFDSRGEAPRAYGNNSELGLYFNDTRHLSIWEITLNGFAPVSLAHELRFGGNTLVISMTNRDLPKLDGSGRIPRDTFLIRKILTLCDDNLYEILAIRNFHDVPYELQLEQWAGSKFSDIFEVRGFPREKRGRMLPAEDLKENDCLTTVFQYEGLDNRIRKTFIRRYFSAEKIRLSPSLSGHFTRVQVPAKGDVLLRTQVAFDQLAEPSIRGRSFHNISVRQTMELLAGRHEEGAFSALRIESDNAILNRSIQNAKIDIQMLLTREEEQQNILYPYAGIPWFSAPFGRDGLICAYQLLPWHPRLAHGVLEYAFSTLGTREDDFTDEQPGKVFHEMRRGEMSCTREVPFIPYYGSVDSTPLALILLHEYISWTMDLEKLKEWWPSALRAMAWIEKWGDVDQDGFLEYAQKSPTGLINQGWKDSHDSIIHQDGKFAHAPIRLCEVQGYAFRARMGMAALARILGHEDLASRLRLEALQLRALFLERYWDVINRYVYLALDGDSKPCMVRSSNMGHCLFSNILPHDHARAVTDHLMSDAMFSGYGIRTLADTEVAYNPMSYHNGSIWPHDNSLILEGFRNYGHLDALEKLSMAMMGVLEASSDFRLPELFCGFRRRGNEPPVPYEVACKPQAWAAGSIFLMLKAMTGLSMDPDQNHVVFRSPILPSKINELGIQGLRGRDWEMDVALRRSRYGVTVDVTRRTGNVRVLTVK